MSWWIVPTNEIIITSRTRLVAKLRGSDLHQTKNQRSKDNRLGRNRHHLKNSNHWMNPINKFYHFWRNSNTKPSKQTQNLRWPYIRSDCTTPCSRDFRSTDTSTWLKTHIYSNWNPASSYIRNSLKQHPICTLYCMAHSSVKQFRMAISGRLCALGTLLAKKLSLSKLRGGLNQWSR